MQRRPELQALLEQTAGNNHVYFQPPPSVKILYPAIIYSRNNISNMHANNDVYKQDFCYEVTVVDKDPDSSIVEAVSLLPKCRFNRHYTVDNLNHDVFIIYY